MKRGFLIGGQLTRQTSQNKGSTQMFNLSPSHSDYSNCFSRKQQLPRQGHLDPEVSGLYDRIDPKKIPSETQRKKIERIMEAKRQNQSRQANIMSGNNEHFTCPSKSNDMTAIKLNMDQKEEKMAFCQSFKNTLRDQSKGVNPFIGQIAGHNMNNILPHSNQQIPAQSNCNHFKSSFNHPQSLENPLNSTLSPSVPVSVDKKEKQFSQPNFRSLFQLLQQKPRIPTVQLKHSIQLFFKWQIEKILGTCSDLPGAGFFSVRDPIILDGHLAQKQVQLVIVKQILQIYSSKIQKQLQLRQNNPQFKALADQVWNALFEHYHERFTDFLAHCYQKMDRDRAEASSKGCQIKNSHDKILERLQALGKHPEKYDSVWKSYQSRQKQMEISRKTREMPKCIWKEIQKNCEKKAQQMKSSLYQSSQFSSSRFRDEKYRNQAVFRQKYKTVSSSNLLLTSKSNLKIISRQQKSSFLDLNNRFTIQNLEMTIQYYFSIEWFYENTDEIPFKSIKNNRSLIKLPLDSDGNQIQIKIMKKMFKEFEKELRPDCQVEFSELKRKRPREFQLHLSIKSVLMNLSQDYSWSVSAWKDYFTACSLIIENQHGKIQWVRDLDMRYIDFEEKGVEIGDNYVKCKQDQMNGPCYVTFYSLPSKLNHKISEKSKQLFQKYVKKMGEVELMNIDWQKKSFTVYFSSFWNEYQSNYASLTSCSKFSRKTSKTLIN